MDFTAMNHEAVLAELKSKREGLTTAEAQKRLSENGRNQLEEGAKKSLLRRIWEQIRDPMVLVLLAAAIVSGAAPLIAEGKLELADTIIILIVVILNVCLGLFQESKAEKAIEALRSMSAPRCRVRRDGAVLDVATEELVLGDIVILEAGSSVPADMRLLESASLKIEEAALTGESVPSEKTAGTLPASDKPIPLGDRDNMAYMGTGVTYGRGEGVVTAAGMNTEMGKIAGILAQTESERTPLQIKLGQLSKVLSAAVLGICAFIFVFGVIRHGGFSGGHVFELFLTAIALAVAAIPEGLVVVVTVLLSIGVTVMSGRSAIIRKLTAVETLGCTQVICSDKTGTLTQNKMTVMEHWGEETLLATALCQCNDTQHAPDGTLLGDPTETALTAYAQKLGLSPGSLPPRVAEAPFDSERKMMSTLHSTQEGKVRQYTKGAPDEIVARCRFILRDGQPVPLTPALRDEVLSANRAMAEKALRVLGAACREYDALPEDISPEALECDMLFIGLVGMIDPIRPEVKAAVAECKQAGVRAVMITGDHKDTAVAIARELGILEDPSQAVTGAELSEMSDEEFEKRIRSLSVYARVQPEHKVRIVKMWQKLGNITAMTGDGVNDAPALKNADIGVGMGITGTDVTKNVADMVLADDNFASIVYAVEEGRRIYENIRKAIQFLLASNLSEVVSIFVATLMSKTLFSPIHILWINLVTDTFPAMALGMEKAESDIMQKPPRKPKESIFAGGLGWQVIYQGVVIAVLTLIAFLIGETHDQITGMTMAFFTLSMCEVFHSLNMRSRRRSIFKMKTQNKMLWGGMALSFVLTFVVIYTPGINGLFKLTPLTLSELGIALALAFSVLPLVELVKLFMQVSEQKRNK